jgi:hypothetical protein
MNPSKVRGTRAETAVVTYLREHGYPHAERRALNGAKDRGDIAGLPGIVVEVKDHGAPRLGTWIDEAKTERDNDGARLGVCLHKRRGKGDVGDWFISMDVRTFLALLEEPR